VRGELGGDALRGNSPRPGRATEGSEFRKVATKKWGPTSIRLSLLERVTRGFLLRWVRIDPGAPYSYSYSSPYSPRLVDESPRLVDEDEDEDEYGEGAPVSSGAC